MRFRDTSPSKRPPPEGRAGGPLEGFDPDAPAVGGGIYGLPHSPEQAGVVLIPVPWEATVSYGEGTADGPAAILQASCQVDLFDRETGRPYEAGIALLPSPDDVRGWSGRARDLLAKGSKADPAYRIQETDRLSVLRNEWVAATARQWLDRGKLVGVIGGDHSSPYGLMQVLAKRHPGLGILQLDAHADLRQAYEGFHWSHASIFWNVCQGLEISKLVQVGVRDYSSGEAETIEGSGGRIVTFFDPDMRARLQEGEPWNRIAREIVDALPSEVYLSVDIDALDPSLCPHTGTPVPGGLSMAEVSSLLRLVGTSGRRVVGFDLCEVAPDPDEKSEWDGNVAARLLYKMIGFAWMSQGRPAVS